MIRIYMNYFIFTIIVYLINQCFGNDLPKRCYTLKSKLQSQITWVENKRINFHNYPIEKSDDNGFEIRVRRVSDNIMVDSWYEPDHEYFITITNRFHSIGFNDLLLWTETEMKKNMELEMGMLDSQKSTTSQTEASSMKKYYCLENGLPDLGKWIHLSETDLQRTSPLYLGLTDNPLTKSRSGCNGRTAELLTYKQKFMTKLDIIWKAPKHEKCGCISLNAAVQAHDYRSRTYSAVGGLKKILCSSSKRPPSPVLPTYMLPSDSQTLDQLQAEKTMKIAQDKSMHLDTMQPQDCCACGSAVYKLTFKGLWTHKTHPKDWPVHNPGSLHWTNLIGASHMPSFQIYRIGEPASAGVQALCSYGDVTIIKQSLGIAASSTGSIGGVPSGTQSGSAGIGPLHSLVSAPGMWGEETLSESRTTFVGVNHTHPLISFLTMLGPSPNWCAGISGQSVCRADCTWADKIEIKLYPWDAGVRHGDTYVPKNSDGKDIPDPIRFITRDWMPNSPFTPGLPVSMVTLERVSPKESWTCSSEMVDGVELFQPDGSTEKIGDKGDQYERNSPAIKSVIGDFSGSLLKKSRNKSGGTVGGPSGTHANRPGNINDDHPLSDPNLAQMATFLCITDSWSAWSPCSVTCGGGRMVRHRVMIANKKPELCQHVPLIEEKACEGIRRTCDFSARCSLLPWTTWTPCNATCENKAGQQTRTRYLARPNEKYSCQHLFKTEMEMNKGMVMEIRTCAPKDTECDPALVCSEGRKDGLPCGRKVEAFYYDAVEHACLPFNYLGCKGGLNRFPNKTACEKFCLPAVERLPAWRRERMVLLQMKTAQIAAGSENAQNFQVLKPSESCKEVMDPGFRCEGDESFPKVRWYFYSRLRICREFDYYGCGGSKNNFLSYSDCLGACLPVELEKLRQMTKARMASSRTITTTTTTNDTNRDLTLSISNQDDDLLPIELKQIENLRGPKQDCELSTWSGWGPCSVRCSNETGTQMRWRYIERPAKFGGQPCDQLFQQRNCVGVMC